jgi:hypothetical protein
MNIIFRRLEAVNRISLSFHMQQALETTYRLRLALRAFAFEKPWVLELSLLCRLTGRVEVPITLEK